MLKINFLRFLKWSLFLFWLFFIFSFSSQNAVQSSQLSNGIVEKILDIFPQIGFDFSFLLRKFAHFSLYFVLGILTFVLLHEYFVSFSKCSFFTILICFLYACSDEFHQLFVSGRNGSFFDVFIDSCGAILSVCVLFGLYSFRNRKKKFVS